MKLIFVNRFFYPDHSATSQLLADLAFNLADKGYQVEVVASATNYDSESKARLKKEESINGVRVHRVWSTGFGRMSLPGKMLDYLTFYITASWRLLRVASPCSVIVAKTDPPLISVIANRVAKLRGAVLVNWLQDLFPEVAINLPVKGLNGWFGRWLIRVRNRSLQSATMNIVLGDKMAEALREAGICDKRIRAIHNWADGRQIKPADSKASELRNEWGLAGKFVVGYSGNMGRAHDYQTILSAMEKLRSSPEICFLFIGGGSQMAELQQEAASRGLTSVVFKPYQPREQLSASLSLPDLHLAVLRPQMEGLIVPSKIYGILAVGRPTIFVGDPDGEVATILQKSEAGIAVAADDDERLVQEILLLQSEPERLQRMGNRAREVFDHSYSMDRAFDQWSKAIPDMLPMELGCLESE